MEEDVGHFIKEWRMEAELSQGELAKLAGMSPAALSMLEAGKASYSKRTLVPIAKALEVTPGMLLDKHPRQVESERGSEFAESILMLLEKIEPEDRELAYELLKSVARHKPKIKKPGLAGLNEHPVYGLKRND
ncbi:helix-turn-helix domain-containing protein [Borborobacter arsenicus]|uniref:helix-turn-helix domain-containing protein n=1 Tax=Borborobacter arsenicus TaxID=1851146 RepID=UPI001404FF59|nr:helix-turn-helix domain-containing protein [Pseudaminobacter arsenicus]